MKSDSDLATQRTMRCDSSFQNSIRHNLSLHSKFVRVQNEGTGKSSWWMLNPDTSNGSTTNAAASSASSGGGQSNKHGSGSKSHLHQHGTGAIGRRRANTLDNW